LDDWGNLFYNFRVIGNFTSAAFQAGPGNPNSLPPPENQPSPEEVHESLARPDIKIEFRVRGGPEDQRRSIEVSIKIDNDGLGLAQNAKLTTKIDGIAHTFSLGTLAPSKSATTIIRLKMPHKRFRATTLFATVSFEDALNMPLPRVSAFTRF